MPDDARPPGITAADLDRWDAGAMEYLAENRLPPMQTRERFLEHYRAGAWLGGELDRLGVDDDQAEAACFAMGQIHAAYVLIGHDDPWKACRLVLKARAAGMPFHPGPGLAAALLKMTQGIDSDPADWPPVSCPGT